MKRVRSYGKKEKGSINWKKDASNNLSYSRMMHKVEFKHPRIVDSNGNRRPFTIFGTHTGCHCCCKRFRKSDIRQLGFGMSTYFKFLKYMMCMFLWFTIVSIPAF
jgi:hypothetical protein